MRDKYLSKAIKIVGGAAALARCLNISREAVRQWTKCPAARVLAVSDATGGVIEPEDLRPDIYRRKRGKAA